MLAESLGIDPRTLGLGGALLSALIRVLLIATFFLLIIGPWEVSTADLFDTVRNIPFGFKIGEIRVSFQAILAAILVMVLLRPQGSSSVGSNGNCCRGPGSNQASVLHRDHLRLRRRITAIALALAGWVRSARSR